MTTARINHIGTLIASTALTLLLALLSTAAQSETVRLGQIVPLTGPLANVGKEISAVSQAAFAQHNANSSLQIATCQSAVQPLFQRFRKTPSVCCHVLALLDAWRK
jgi:hypothetical protein